MLRWPYFCSNGWVFFFQIKNVEDIERCFLRLWDKNKTDQLHIETTICIERNIVMEFAQDQLNSVSFSRNFSIFQWRKFLHDLLLVIFTGKEVHIICVRISSKSLYHMKRHPSKRSEEKVAIVIMDQVLLIQYSQNAIY